MPPAAVLFDLDGVLIDSQDAWYHLLSAAAKALGHPAIPRDAFDACFGQGVEADAEQFFGGIDPAELEAYFDAHFLDHASHVLVNPDAAPVLNALSQRGIVHAVVTNTASALAKETLRGAGLEPDLIVGASDAAGKPAPDMLWLACERLGVATADAWMVGDSRFDREAARAAGVSFVGYGVDGERRIERLTELLFLEES
jgi:phosphoglycolate phosphatase/AHBA synthesis associated protein